MAKISLPVSVSDTKDQYVVHPSIMEAALQAALGLVSDAPNINNAVPGKPLVPMVLQELNIFDNCTSLMWASIRCDEGMTNGEYTRKLNIDLCDDTGKVVYTDQRIFIPSP